MWRTLWFITIELTTQARVAPTTSSSCLGARELSTKMGVSPTGPEAWQPYPLCACLSVPWREKEETEEGARSLHIKGMQAEEFRTGRLLRVSLSALAR